MNASKRSPGLALAADVLAVVFLAAGFASLFINDLTLRIVGLRISMRTPWRPFALAVLVLVIRNILAPRPPSFAWAAAPFRRFSFARFAQEARDPLQLDESALFRRTSWRELALLMLGFSALVAALTWPQVARLEWVADLGDPLFSAWRIAWVSHQFPRNPLALFDANQFHPERLTLTYSDSLLVPALMSAPLFWMGVHPIVAYNLLLLSGFVLSGVTMYLLARALTGRIDAALIAGVMFAVYPYRYEHYSHLELEMTMWMPLALLGLHRTLARGRWRDGLATGLAFALQTLSSLYYGCFLAVYLVVTGGALWLGRGRPRHAVAPLAAGVALAAVLIAPVAAQYIASRPMMGE
jgi:hypothetical protein